MACPNGAGVSEPDPGNRDIRKPAVACRNGAGAPEPYSCIILEIVKIVKILLLRLYSLANPAPVFSSLANPAPAFVLGGIRPPLGGRCLSLFGSGRARTTEMGPMRSGIRLPAKAGDIPKRRYETPSDNVEN